MLTVKTKEALELWLSLYPGSNHPCDMDRFYSVIKISSEQNDLDSLLAIDLFEVVKDVTPEWDDADAREFAAEWEEKISLCKGLIDFLDKHK